MLAGCHFTGGHAASDGALTGSDAPADTMRDGSASQVAMKTLVFDMSWSATDIGMAPVLVTLDSSVIDTTAVADPSHDLRFHDPATASDVAFEIERWVPAATSYVWVFVPTLHAGSTTDTLQLFYGPGAGGTENPSGPWASGFELVEHFGSRAGGLANSAGASYAGATAGNATTGPGLIGDGVVFSGIGDNQFTFANAGALFDGWSTFTIDFWLRSDADTVQGIEPKFMDKGVGLSNGRIFHNATDVLRAQIDWQFTNANAFLNTSALTVGQWMYISYSYDHRVLWMYVNGQQHNVQDTGMQQSLPVNALPFHLGDGTGPIHGMLDEVRISQISHTQQWFELQYRAAMGRLITFQ